MIREGGWVYIPLSCSAVVDSQCFIIDVKRLVDYRTQEAQVYDRGHSRIVWYQSSDATVEPCSSSHFNSWYNDGRIATSTISQMTGEALPREEDWQTRGTHSHLNLQILLHYRDCVISKHIVTSLSGII